MVVLDTSVVAKWFLEEDGSDRAVKIRDAFLNKSMPIAICDLTLYEPGNLLKFKGFSHKDIDKALASILDIIVPTKGMLELTARAAETHSLTFYDAAFVALAQEGDI